MKVRRGSCRIVFFIGPVVVKVCRIHSLLRIWSEVWYALRKNWWSFLPGACSDKWQWFMKGIRQNTSEYQCWKKTRASFLVPTYFTCGILNIQKAEDGEQPTHK